MAPNFLFILHTIFPPEPSTMEWVVTWCAWGNSPFTSFLSSNTSCPIPLALGRNRRWSFTCRFGSISLITGWITDFFPPFIPGSGCRIFSRSKYAWHESLLHSYAEAWSSYGMFNTGLLTISMHLLRLHIRFFLPFSGPYIGKSELSRAISSGYASDRLHHWTRDAPTQWRTLPVSKCESI